MNALRALLSNREKPIDLELCFMTGEGEVVLGHHVPILSAWNALRIKEIKVLEVLLSLPCSYYLWLSVLSWACGAAGVTVQQLCPTHSSLPSRLGREYILLLAARVAHITHFIWVWRLKRVKRVG